MNNIADRSLASWICAGLSAQIRRSGVVFAGSQLFVVAFFLTFLVSSCRSQVERQPQIDRVDSLAPYRIALDFLQGKRLIPSGEYHGSGPVPVYVYGKLTCIPIDASDINGYADIMQIAKSDRYKSYGGARTAHPCQDHYWPIIQQLSNTTSKRVIVRFDEADSVSFSPLVMVSCLVYDNKYNRDEPDWYDFSDVDYFNYVVFIDPMGSVVYYLGGRSEQ